MEVCNIKEIYVTANKLSKITGRPLPQIIEEIKNGRIKTTVSQKNGMTIPLSQFYPISWVYIE